MKLNKLRRWWGGGLALAALGIVIWMAAFRWTPVEAALMLRDNVAALGWWGPVVYVLLYTVRPLLFFPAIFFTLAAPMLFGPLRGTIYVLLGGTLGACLCFVVARYLARGWVAGWDIKHPLWRQLQQAGREQGFRWLLMLRLVPVFHYDIVSYGAGLSAIKFAPFAWATILGILPGAVLYNYFGFTAWQIIANASAKAVAFGATGVFVAGGIWLLHRRLR